MKQKDDGIRELEESLSQVLTLLNRRQDQATGPSVRRNTWTRPVTTWESQTQASSPRPCTACYALANKLKGPCQFSGAGQQHWYQFFNTPTNSGAALRTTSTLPLLASTILSTRSSSQQNEVTPQTFSREFLPAILGSIPNDSNSSTFSRSIHWHSTTRSGSLAVSGRLFCEDRGCHCCPCKLKKSWIAEEVYNEVWPDKYKRLVFIKFDSDDSPWDHVTVFEIECGPIASNENLKFSSFLHPSPGIHTTWFNNQLHNSISTWEQMVEKFTQLISNPYRCP